MRSSDRKQSSRRTSVSTWHRSVGTSTVSWPRRTRYWSMCWHRTTQKTDLVLSMPSLNNGWETSLVVSARTSRGKWPAQMKNKRLLRYLSILPYLLASLLISTCLRSLSPRTTSLCTRMSLSGVWATKESNTQVKKTNPSETEGGLSIFLGNVDSKEFAYHRPLGDVLSEHEIWTEVW